MAACRRQRQVKCQEFLQWPADSLLESIPRLFKFFSLKLVAFSARIGQTTLQSPQRVLWLRIHCAIYTFWFRKLLWALLTLVA
jgi:hypothetical protein